MTQTKKQGEKSNLEYRNRGLMCLFYGGIIAFMMIVFLDYVRESIGIILLLIIPLAFFVIVAFYFLFVKWNFTQEEAQKQNDA